MTMGKAETCRDCGQEKISGTSHHCENAAPDFSIPGCTVTGRMLSSDDCWLVQARDSETGALLLARELSSRIVADPDLLRRAEFGAEAVQKHSPGGVVPVLRILDQPHAVVSPWIDGPSIGALLATRALAVDEAFALCDSVASSMTNLHDLGVLHGYLSLDRVIVDPKGVPLVTGAGIDLGEHPSVEASVLLAPEVRAQGLSAIGPSADVFAVGRLLQIVTLGTAPLTDEQAAAIIPEWVLALILSATADDPGQRCSMLAFRQQLDAGATSMSGAGWLAAGTAGLASAVAAVGGAAVLSAAMTAGAATAVGASSAVVGGTAVGVTGFFAAQPLLAWVVVGVVGLGVLGGGGVVAYQAITSSTSGASAGTTSASASPGDNSSSESGSAIESPTASPAAAFVDDGLYPQGMSLWSVQVDEGAGYPSPTLVFRAGERVCYMNSFGPQEWVGKATLQNGTPTLTGTSWNGSTAFSSEEAPIREGSALAFEYDQGNWVLTETWTPIDSAEANRMLSSPEYGPASSLSLPMMESTAKGLCESADWPNFNAARMQTLKQPPSPAASSASLPQGRTYWTNPDGDIMAFDLLGTQVKMVYTMSSGNSRCMVGTLEDGTITGAERSAGDFQAIKPFEVNSSAERLSVVNSNGFIQYWTPLPSASEDADALAWSLDRCSQ